jgi:uncharacterized protein (TIGR02271 family)
MVSTHEVQDLLAQGGTVVSQDGSKIGSVGQVFLDDLTGEPEWVTVKTGMFGGAESFVPLASATIQGDQVRVPFNKDTVKDAPRVNDSDGHLSEDEEDELFRYYNHNGADGRGQLAGEGAGHDTSGPDTDDAMTRSEEQLRVGTEKVSTGKARLRKYVVTENVTTTVPVSHEEVRVEREPITEANRDDALAGGDITSEEHEVELSAERVVVDKEAVPVERVRMDVETVTEDQQVSEEVRKEQIEADGPDSPAADTTR